MSLPEQKDSKSAAGQGNIYKCNHNDKIIVKSLMHCYKLAKKYRSEILKQQLTVSLL